MPRIQVWGRREREGEVNCCWRPYVARQNLRKSRAQLTWRFEMYVRHRVSDAVSEFNLTLSSLELRICLKKCYLFAMAVNSKLLECRWKCQLCWWRWNILGFPCDLLVIARGLLPELHWQEVLLCKVQDVEWSCCGSIRPRRDQLKLKLKNPLKSCEIPKEETAVQLVVKCDQFVCLAKPESCSLAVMLIHMARFELCWLLC